MTAITVSFSVELNDQGITQLVNSEKVGKLVGQTGDSVARMAKADSSRFIGRTIRSHQSEIGPNGWRVFVTTDSPFWHIGEYGSVNNVGVRAFARAVTAHGLEFTEG